MYKVILNKRGNKMYYKEGKMVSKDSIPEEIRLELEAEEPSTPMDEVEKGEVIVDDDEDGQPELGHSEILSEPPRECVFCRQYGTRRRFINLQTVFLCDIHYEVQTAGEIVAQMKGVQEVR